jgi:prepilin-type N-terminal cleavage/methylation domain-containing protein
MKSQKGFSLLEVLIALLLITSSSIVLLQQQWQLSQFLNQVISDSQALILSDNHYEKHSPV